MSTRPAIPGDNAIVIADEFAGGRNVGKTCHVDCQCACDETYWEVTTLEPFVAVVNFFDIEKISFRTDSGCKFCFRKTALIAKDDPDEKSETPLEELLKHFELQV